MTGRGLLAGKVALVTGGAGGQGRAACELFLAEGAQVAAVDINADGLEELAADAGSDRLRTWACDVSDPDRVTEVVAAVDRDLGPVTILHNNAGAVLRSASGDPQQEDGGVVDLSESVYDRTMAINLRSAFLFSKQVLPQMIAAGGGSIICVASEGGAILGSTNHAYACSKGAMVGLAKAMGRTYGPKGVRVNVLVPGFIPTDLAAFILDNPTYHARYTEGAALKRDGSVEDMARAALFLASEESAFITGDTLVVDGGYLLS
jgi:NAD(P)-dependent dehydrogenase (short-subunit alcohol dehydrogenase family)